MEVVGDYSIQRSSKNVLGRGAFAVVYKGRHNRTNEAVAVKVISKKNIVSSHQLSSEIKILQKLTEINHENLVTLLACVETSSEVFLVMQVICLSWPEATKRSYCNARDLADFLKAGQLTENATAMFARQIVAGMKALLDKGIIHRDIKPHNILLIHIGHHSAQRLSPEKLIVKLGDFGMAKCLEQDVMTSTLCGSPVYMAPEVHLRCNYGVKADLFSLGVVLYECVMGTVPFRCSTPLQLARFYESKAELEPQISQNVSAELKDLLLGLLKKNPDDRMDIDAVSNHAFLHKSSLRRNPYTTAEFTEVPLDDGACGGMDKAGRGMAVAGLDQRLVRYHSLPRELAALSSSPGRGRRMERGEPKVSAQPSSLPSTPILRPAKTPASVQPAPRPSSPDLSDFVIVPDIISELPEDGKMKGTPEKSSRERSGVRKTSCCDPIHEDDEEVEKFTRCQERSEGLPVPVPARLRQEEKGSPARQSPGSSPSLSGRGSRMSRRTSICSNISLESISPPPVHFFLDSPPGSPSWSRHAFPALTYSSTSSPGVHRAVTYPNLSSADQTRTRTRIPSGQTVLAQSVRQKLFGSDQRIHGDSMFGATSSISIDSMEGVIQFVIPPLSDRTIMDKDQNHLCQKLEYVLHLAKAILNLATNMLPPHQMESVCDMQGDGPACEGTPVPEDPETSEGRYKTAEFDMGEGEDSGEAGGAAAMSGSGQKSSVSITSSYFQTLVNNSSPVELLTLYMKAVELLQEGMRFAKTVAGKFPKSASFTEIVSKLYAEQAACLQFCKQLTTKQNSEVTVSIGSVDGLLCELAMEKCKTAAEDESFGRQQYSLEQYRTAYLVLHFLHEQSHDQAAKEYFIKVLKGISRRLEELTKNRER